MLLTDKKSAKSLDTPGFPSFSITEFTKFKAAIGATTNYYMQGEKIFRYSKLGISNMAYVSEGNVILQTTDEKGSIICTEVLKKGDVLGELFGFPPPGYDYTVFAKSDCSVVFFDVQKLMHPCENMCSHHISFLNELFKISSEKLKQRDMRLIYLSYKTLREKLLAYFRSESIKANSASFELSMNQTSLASYLLSDRSALARELSLMKSEGIINYKGKHFEILKSEQ